MTVVSLGLVKDTAGAATPLPVASGTRCRLLRFRAWNGVTGIVSIGLVGFTPGGAGMIGEVLKPAAGFSDEIVIGPSAGNDIYPGDYSVKPAANGDGVYVSYEPQ
jgi:hypothetical protein